MWLMLCLLHDLSTKKCNIECTISLYGLQWRVAEVCQRLEHDLHILGVAAIEDRLQVF